MCNIRVYTFDGCLPLLKAIMPIGYTYIRQMSGKISLYLSLVKEKPPELISEGLTVSQRINRDYIISTGCKSQYCNSPEASNYHPQAIFE